MKPEIYGLFADRPAPCLDISNPVLAGFPSPAEDFAQKRIDLNDVLIHNPDSTFYMRVRGDSMRDAGINDGDRILVDRSLEAHHGDIVVAVVDNEFTVKTLFQRHGKTRLVPANPTYPDIVLRDGQELVIWGVVLWAFKQVSHRSASR